MRITYIPTQEDYINNQRAHAWRRYSPTMARLQKALEPVAGLALLWYSFHLYRRGVTSALVLVEGLMGLYVLLATPVIAPYFYRRAFRRRHSFAGENVIEFTNDQIVIDCPGQSSGSVQWQAVRGILDTPKTTLLYLSAASFLPVPRRLVTDEQHKKLLDICHNHRIPYGSPKPAPK